MPAGEAPRGRAGRARSAGGPRQTRGRGQSGSRASRSSTATKGPVTGLGAAPGSRGRAPAGEQIRDTRARRVAVATSGILGLSSTRRAAVLALVVCALALTVAVPLRNFLTQRTDLADLRIEQQQKTQQLAGLTARIYQLRDPAYVKAEARERLSYVQAGEIPYVVQTPGEGAAAQAGPGPGGPAPWFDRLWSDVRGVRR
jgi:cell division protein FtsB